MFADFKMNNPREAVHSVFFRPMGQEYSGFKEPGMIAGEKSSMYLGSVMLDFSRPQPDAEALVRRTLAEIDPNLTIFHFDSLDAQVAGNFNQDRLVARLTMLFGVLALVLASVGLYGVISYFVVRRTAEIGIRMALGATRGSVLTMVLRGALWQIVIGLALGIPAALLAGHLVSSQLYGVTGYDPLALLAALLMLSLCATVAGLIPARRAASIEPMKALRTE